jgi:hypothetical protein
MVGQRVSRVLWIGCLAVAALSCRPTPTGILVDVKLGELRLDELRFEVSVAKVNDLDGVPQPDTRTLLVDPLGNGRVLGPFFGGDETQPIVLDDSLDGRGVSCVVTGFVGDMAIAYGRNNARVVAHSFTDMSVVVAGAMTLSPGRDASSGVIDGGAPDAGEDAPSPSGSDGGAGTGGMMPMSGSGGASGTGGMMPMSGSGGTVGSGGSGGTRDAGTPGSGGAGGNMPPPDAGPVDRPPPLKDNGTRCAAAGECRSVHCVDGVCCADACQGACRTCNAAGRAGSCVNVGAGVRDPRGACPNRGGSSCDTNGTCNGNGGCALFPSGTVCIGPSCRNKNFQIPASTCDGAGACVDHAMIKCDKGMECTNNACQ